MMADDTELDSCLQADLDYDNIIAAISADVGLSASVSVVAGASQNDLSGGVTMPFIQEVCFENRLMEADVITLQSVTKATLQAMDSCKQMNTIG